MSVYMEMLMVSAVTVYIVDLSGFTDNWRGALSRMLGGVRLRPLPPFDCGQCMSWWACLIYVLCVGKFSLATVAWSAFLAFMSTVTGGLLTLVRDAVAKIIDVIYGKWL